MTTPQTSAIEALRKIIDTYAAYRAVGVGPAPVKYADLVAAIDQARAALAAVDAEPKPTTDLDKFFAEAERIGLTHWTPEMTAAVAKRSAELEQSMTSAQPAEPVQEPVESALARFEANGETDELSPLERLRFFCSLAMTGQDWLDVEPFFDALKPAEPLAGMSEINRLIAYTAAEKLRELGYEWTGDDWTAQSVKDWPHIANEWADMALEGLQWLRNITEGISDPKGALANMERCLKHCREVNDATPEPVADSSKWVEAVGLLSCLCLLEIDTNDPVGMAQKIVAYVQATPQRQQLSEEQIDQICKGITTVQRGRVAIEFARAIERAHGIGEKT